MLVPTGKLIDLHYLGFRNVMRIDSADSLATGVDMQHHLGGFFPVHPEEMFENPHYKVHGSIVIVQQNNLVQRRRFERGLFRLDHRAVILVGGLG